MVLYSAVSSPLDRSKRFTLSSPGIIIKRDPILLFIDYYNGHLIYFLFYMLNLGNDSFRIPVSHKHICLFIT